MVEMFWQQAGKRYRVLRDDTEEARLKFTAYKCTVTKNNGTLVVAYRDDEGNRRLLHRWIINAREDDLVVAKDGNYLNLQISNLETRKRSMVSFETAKLSGNPNGYRGVTFNRKSQKYVAQIAKYYIGSYSTVEEAARAYDDQCFKIRGVRVNFPLPHNDTSNSS